MKFTACCFLILLLSGCSVVGQVVIRGKIIGYDGKSLVYYHPTIEGIYTPYWKEVKPTANGSFRIEYKNEGYGNARVAYKGTGYRFFHDSDSEIYLEMREQDRGKRKRVVGQKIFVYADSIKQAVTTKITGDYEHINRFYNRTLRSSYFTTRMVDGNYYSNMVYRAATPSAAVNVIDSLAQIELDQINRLPWRLDVENPTVQKKDKEIRDFLINEVHAFYGAVFLNGMFLKRKEHVTTMMQDSTAKPDIYNRDWELLIEGLHAQMKENLKVAAGSPDYIEFMESMAHTIHVYKQYDFPQNPAATLDEMVTDRLFNYDTTLFADAKSRQAYELSGLHLYLNNQLFFSPSLLHAVYTLQTKYPQSENLRFFAPHIEKLQKSLEVSATEYPDARIIGANISSFDKLVKRFEGKNLLIDIWATWCHPCIEDFKFKDSIQPFIDSKQIEILYISIDKAQWRDRWRQSIKINGLAGNHFRADEQFIRDMWEVLGDFKGAIPRYVLIDKRGSIYKRTASRPSDGSRLADEIEALISQPHEIR